MPHLKCFLSHEDNQAMIHVMKTGRNPTMRHVGRTHRISIAALREYFRMPDFTLCKEASSRMAADIYTKAFENPLRWQIVCELINLVDPARLGDKKYVQELLDSAPTTSGGGVLLRLWPMARRFDLRPGPLPSRVGMRIPRTIDGFTSVTSLRLFMYPHTN